MRYHVYQFSDKTDTFDFLGPNLPKNGFWGRNFKNLNLDLESASLRYHMYQFSGNRRLRIFGPKFAPKWILGSEFQKPKSVFGINTSNIPCQFSVKMDNVWFFGLNLAKLPSYAQYFGSNIVEGVAESWVETEMSWVEVEQPFTVVRHKIVLKNFTKFRAKHLYRTLYFDKVASSRPATWNERAPITIHSSEVYEIFRNSYFVKHLWTTALEHLLYWNTILVISTCHAILILPQKTRNRV